MRFSSNDKQYRSARKTQNFKVHKNAFYRDETHKFCYRSEQQTSQSGTSSITDVRKDTSLPDAGTVAEYEEKLVQVLLKSFDSNEFNSSR